MISPLVTMTHIAQRAGLSRRAVSDALNDRPSFVSVATRERVKKLAEEMGYRPNFLARSLRQGTTRCIGVMAGPTIADFSFPYVAATVSGIITAMDARRSLYSPLIFGANYHAEDSDTIALIRRGLVDGLVLVILSVHLDHFLRVVRPVLEECRLPYVVITSLARELPCPHVGLDAGAGLRQAVAHLAGLGRRDIRMSLLGPWTPIAQDAAEAFRAALREHALPAGEDALYAIQHGTGLQDYQDAFAFARALAPLPEAIISSSDDDAVGLLHGLRARGVRVPEDVALVARHAALPSPWFTGELTAVTNPVAEKARIAVDLLHDLIERRDVGGPAPQRILPAGLSIGTTCGARLGTKV